MSIRWVTLLASVLLILTGVFFTMIQTVFAYPYPYGAIFAFVNGVAFGCLALLCREWITQEVKSENP